MSKFKISKSDFGAVLLYHRIGDPNSGNEPISDGLKVSPEIFEKTIKWFLSRGYNFVSLNEIHDFITGRVKPKNNKNICLTFDDGYKDNLYDLLPIAKKYNLPFAVYIAAYAPDSRLFTWWNTLEELLLKNDIIELSDGSLYKCATIAEKWSSFWALREKVILMAKGKEMEAAFQSLFAKYNFDMYDYSQKQYLNWDEVILLDSEPLCTIAAHSCTHVAMDVASPEVVKHEMDESIAILESHLGHKIEHFAYPFGLFNKDNLEIMKDYQSKIKTFTTTDNGYINSDTNLLLVPRIHSIEKILFEKGYNRPKKMKVFYKEKTLTHKIYHIFGLKIKLPRKNKKSSEAQKLQMMFDMFDELKTKHYPQGWNWIDRVYIEDFLEKNKDYITGSILEFKDDMYIKKYAHNITHQDVFTHPSDTQNSIATIFGDICDLENIPQNQYDCIICTQVLPFIYDYEKAIIGLKQMLKPQGVLLVTVPGFIALVATAEMKETGHFYGFSSRAMKQSFSKHFNNFEVSSYGNAKAAMLFMGFADSTLLPKEQLLESSDDHIITVAVKAIKE